MRALIPHTERATFFWALVCELIAEIAKTTQTLFKLMTTSSNFVKDPVCGMVVDPITAKAKVEYAGQTYYFCCTGCAQKFQSNPEQYLKVAQPTLVTIGGSAMLESKTSPEQGSTH